MKFAIFFLCCVLQSICGSELSDFIMYPPEATSTRIVGGTDAKDGEAPYQCSMQLNRRHFCGCALISPEWIVTASHCVSGQQPQNIEIMVGSNDLKTGGTYYKIEKYMMHEKYNNPMYANDIAVMRVAGSIKFDEKVQAITLSPEEVPEGTGLKLTGWGRLTAGGALPQLLQTINLKAVTTKRCKEIYNGRVTVDPSHICTFTKVGEGACNGDSGGPLVWNNTLVGLVNWGMPCARGFPDAYAKVSYLIDWVKSKTQM